MDESQVKKIEDIISNDLSLEELRKEFDIDLNDLIDLSKADCLDGMTKVRLLDIIDNLFQYRIVFLYAEYTEENDLLIPEPLSDYIANTYSMTGDEIRVFARDRGF